MANVTKGVPIRSRRMTRYPEIVRGEDRGAWTIRGENKLGLYRQCGGAGMWVE
jgi:hypothetical protein